MNAFVLRTMGAFVVLTWAAVAQEPSALTEEQILSRCVAELQKSEVSRQLERYSFTMRITAENYNRNGKLMSEDQREYQFTPRPDGRMDVRLLSVKGAPPSKKDLEKQEKEMRKELAKSDAQVAEEKKKTEEEDTRLSKDFLQFFDFKFAGREPWNGVPAFVVEFTPKPELSERKDKSDKILRNMAGRMWVSQERFQILATEMHSLHNVHIWGGLSGVDNLVSRMEYMTDAEGEYLPKVDSAEWELRVGLSKFRFSRKQEFSNFQKVEVKPVPTAPPN